MVDYGLKDRVALITGANNPGPLTRQRLTETELTDISRPMLEMQMS